MPGFGKYYFVVASLVIAGTLPNKSETTELTDEHAEKDLQASRAMVKLKHYLS